jgi:hypothetical protein
MLPKASGHNENKKCVRPCGNLRVWVDVGFAQAEKGAPASANLARGALAGF